MINTIQGYVIANKMVMTGKLPLLRVYREKPDEVGDTGWRIFSGTEDESFANEPANFGIYDIKEVVALDETVKEILGAPAGVEYVKATAASAWEKI
jgi:hypothetical protein